MGENLFARCNICESESSYDSTALKNSTWKINGVECVICLNCEHQLFIKMLKARISKKKMLELTERLMMDEQQDIMNLYN